MADKTAQIDMVYDVVICGAGLAGLSLARQITRELPQLSILLIEGAGDKASTAAVNVGESTIEISAYYLADVLGLRSYLETYQYRKLGLRFFFGDPTGSFEARPEFGIREFSRIDSFQLDRKHLETDLKKFNAEMGIQMLTECKVEDIELAEGDTDLHKITVGLGNTNQRQVIKSRWIVDAMGRRRFIQKKLGLALPKNKHFSAAWFRLAGRVDIADLVPASATHWHEQVPGGNRYYSTNHLMGKGRWVWLIPLAPDSTSVGIVAQEDFHPFAEYNTYERALQWLARHEPLLRDMIGEQEPLDFQCLRHYSYSARQVFSAQRWACTGDAAVFADPFYSPGIDQIGFANTFITEMLRRDCAQTLEPQTVERFNRAFLSFHSATSWLIYNGYPFHNNALVMGAKILWNFAINFLTVGPQRFNRTYIDEQKTEVVEPFLARVGPLAFRVENFFKEWAALSTGRYAYTFLNHFTIPGMTEHYYQSFRSNKTLEELCNEYQATLEYLEEMAQLIFLLALADVKPELYAQLPDPLWINAWSISLDPERWSVDQLFAPVSSPRPLNYAEFFAKFGVPAPLSLLQKQ